MSSIFGAWHLNQKPLSPKSIQQAIAQTAWWQPDKKGQYQEKNLFLAHQLLATLPKEQEEVQPYQDALVDLRIVADARLDNKQEVLGKLGMKVSIPNYQLIAEAYKRWGTDCIKHLVGAFTFAIWDAKKQQLFVARDQMGEKPLNYYYKDNLFAFGTQKKSILAIEGVDKTPNWRNILNQISSLGIPASSSEYQHIHRLAPDHCIILNSSGIKIQRYWKLDIHQSIQYKKEEDYVLHFRELFEQAITDRLATNQLAGAHLSGGLDS